MNSMTNLRPSYDEFEDEAEQFDELVGELEVLDEFERDNPFLEFEEDDEWLGEVGRQSRDFICWVQSSLNKILGLRLSVDGNMGPQTKSAIRSFQQKQGLIADGIVGEKTERALKSALGSSTTIQPSLPPGVSINIPPNSTVKAPEKIDKFDKDSSQLKNPHHAAINRIANRIALSWKSGIPIATVYVKGHASSEGKPQHNMGLGKSRSLAVRKQLMKALENQQKNLSYKVLILAQSKGDTNPTASNNTENGRLLNRRVEVFLSTKVLLPIKPPPPPPPKDINPTYIWPDLDFSHPRPPDEPYCDNTLYLELKKRALKNLIYGIKNCLERYIDHETSSIDTAISTIGSALTALGTPVVGVPIAFVVGLVGGAAVQWKSFRARQDAIECATKLAENYNNEVRSARDKTHCL